MKPGWRKTRLGHVANVIVSNVDKHSVDGQGAVRLCNYVDVYKNDLITSDLDFMRATATADQVRAFSLRPNDVLITKDSESPDDIAVPALVRYTAPDLVCGYHLAIIRARQSEADGPFLAWLMRSSSALAYWPTVARGMTRYGIRTQDIAAFPLYLPPLPEQRAIAAFLDRETAEIDALVEAQEALIDTLRERRAAVIDSVIHPSLGPRTKLLALSIGGIASGVDYSAGEGEPTWLRYVRTTDVEGMASLSPDTVRRITREQAAASTLRRDDILFTRSGSLGVNYLHESDEPMAFAGYMVRLRPNLALCVPRFVAWWSQSRQHLDQIALGKTVSTIENFSGGKFASMRIPLPPLDEQQRIANYLDEKTAEIDALIAETERFIALSKERRAALITAAVTGQIDVMAKMGVA